uniref:Uncharacterized protein n=1 Tax=Anopheles culicifacies TaxID=139723 RepID=A0A182MC12_9DIPT
MGHRKSDFPAGNKRSPVIAFSMRASNNPSVVLSPSETYMKKITPGTLRTVSASNSFVAYPPPCITPPACFVHRSSCSRPASGVCSYSSFATYRKGPVRMSNFSCEKQLARRKTRANLRSRTKSLSSARKDCWSGPTNGARICSTSSFSAWEM